MATTFTSINMGLVLPVPGVDPGPDYANNQNSSMLLIDSHDHSSGKGVQINPSGININSAFSLNNNNLTAINSLQLAAISGTPAVTTVYSNGTDLFYKDSSGNAVQITSGGSVNGSSGTISGLPSGTASASFQSGSGTFVFQQATSTAANFDTGTIVLRYPGSYPSPAGNYIMLKAPSSLSGGYSLTLPAAVAASSGAFLTSSSGGALSYTNVDNITIEINTATLRVKAAGITANELASNSVTTVKILDANVTTAKILDSNVTTAKIADQNVTQAKLQVRAVGGSNIGTPVAAGGFAVSDAVDSATTTSGSFTTVTGSNGKSLQCAITTTGRPVMIMISPIGSNQPGGITTGSAGIAPSIFRITRDGTDIGQFKVSFANGTSFLPVSAIAVPDTGVAAGTHVYVVQYLLGTSATSLTISDCALVAYET